MRKAIGLPLVGRTLLNRVSAERPKGFQIHPWDGLPDHTVCLLDNYVLINKQGQHVVKAVWRAP